MDRTSGFTLVEMLVTVAVVGVVMTAAAPGFRSMMLAQRQTAQTNTLVMSLAFARSEAIKRDADVVVCASNDQVSCLPSTTSSAWTNGWIVGVAGTTDCAPSAVLQVLPPLSGGNTLNATASGATASCMTFKSNGWVLTGGLQANVAFSLCDSRGATWAQAIELNATGGVMTAKQQGKSLNNVSLSCS